MADHNHDHDHERTVKPMVDEITDFEVLEIALRELCRPNTGGATGSQGVAGLRFQEARPRRTDDGQ